MVSQRVQGPRVRGLGLFGSAASQGQALCSERGGGQGEEERKEVGPKWGGFFHSKIKRKRAQREVRPASSKAPKWPSLVLLHRLLLSWVSAPTWRLRPKTQESHPGPRWRLCFPLHFARFYPFSPIFIIFTHFHPFSHLHYRCPTA